MSNPENYQVKYWAGGNDFTYGNPKSPRSVKRKLFIVFSFLAVLVIIPVLILGFSGTSSQKNVKKVSIITSPLPQTKETPRVIPVTITEPEDGNSIQTEVINNDSYWKITKRVCGNGKYYLSVKDQNGGKALYLGDTVSVACVI
jgi:hypothetical protein